MYDTLNVYILPITGILIQRYYLEVQFKRLYIIDNIFHLSIIAITSFEDNVLYHSAIWNVIYYFHMDYTNNFVQDSLYIIQTINNTLYSHI